MDNFSWCITASAKRSAFGLALQLQSKAPVGAHMKIVTGYFSIGDLSPSYLSLPIKFLTGIFLPVLFFSVSSWAEFKIIPRTEWNAEAARSAQMIPVNPQAYDAITLHFPVGAELNECGSMTVLNYQKKMMTEQSLPDVPFQFLIDRCGNIYQGQELNSLPIHAGSTLEFMQQMDVSLNPNFQNIGIALLSRSSSQLSTAHQAAAVWLIDHLRGPLNIQSVMQMEQLKRSIELCDYQFVANGYIKTVNSEEQNEAAKGIQNFFRHVLQIGRHNSLCASTY